MNRESLSAYRILKLLDRQIVRDTTIHMTILTSKIKEYTDRRVINVRPLKLKASEITAKKSFLGTINSLVLAFPKYANTTKIQNIVRANASKYVLANLYSSDDGHKKILKYTTYYEQLLGTISDQESEELVGLIEQNKDYQDVDNRRHLNITQNNVKSFQAYMGTINNQHLNFYLLFGKDIPEKAQMKLQTDNVWGFKVTYQNEEAMKKSLERYHELGTLSANLKEQYRKLMENNIHWREMIKTSYMRQNYKKKFKGYMDRQLARLKDHDQNIFNRVHDEQIKLYNSVG